MCLTEFIFRATFPETLEYPAYYLLRKMFRETALEMGPFTIFLKANYMGKAVSIFSRCLSTKMYSFLSRVTFFI
jgi:hypothetical protein